MRSVAQRIASVMGFRVPAANGATVKGMRAAEINLLTLHQLLFRWYDSNALAVRMPNDSSHELATVGVPVLDRLLVSS